MIPKLAIEKAIEGGWRPEIKEWLKEASGDFNQLRGYQWEQLFANDAWQKIALDPTFWQALGKALGWPTEQEWDDDWREREKGWRDVAHRFYDLILHGKDTTEFWKELLG